MGDRLRSPPVTNPYNVGTFALGLSFYRRWSDWWFAFALEDGPCQVLFFFSFSHSGLRRNLGQISIKIRSRITGNDPVSLRIAYR